MCFIDYSKAFDFVSHSQLWATLIQMGFQEREISLIKELYKGQEAAIRTNCGITEWFKIERGVRQGCILSPYLFNIYTEDIMREVGEDWKTVNFNELNIHGHKIRDLRYADDTILLSHGTSGLSHLVESVDKHSSEKCLKLNAKKTKLMKTDKSKEDLEIKVDSEILECVPKYVYLGSTVSGDGDGTEEIRRLAMATNKLSELKFLWNGQDPQTKLRIVRARIFPIATYGCEAWTLGKTILKRITAFEKKCYRKILKISWTEHRTNTSIRDELKLEDQ